MISLRRPGPATRVLLPTVILTVLFACINASSAFAQATGLPAPWAAQDIGSPAIAGTVTFNQGTFSVDAAGADIFGTTDQFHFTYRQVTGDVDVIARVDSLGATNEWSKAGVMIRGSLSAGSAHAFAHITATHGLRFMRRLQNGGVTTSTAGPVAVAPRWVRLVRAGTKITSYWSADGTTWTTIGSDTIALGATAYVGLAVVSCNTGMPTGADFSQVSVLPLASTLPSSQQAQDIGNPALAGSTTFSGGTYTIKAGGTDIWDVADQFHFVYQPVTGDVDVVVRVASISNASSWSKAGVMVRESLAAGSRHASAMTSRSMGYVFRRRLDPNGFTTNTSGGSGAPPGWVRLVRTGDRFDSYRSANGTTWQLMGSDTVPMASAVYVGIAVTSRNTSVTTTAIADSLTVLAGATPPNQAPTVSLTAPVNNATYTAPATVAFAATASDPDGTVARVEFYNGATLLGTDTSAPYSYSWGSVAAGTYLLKAIAYDAAGLSGSSAVVTVVVNPGTNKPPTVSLTAPANNATYTAPATVGMTATASDPDGTVARVEFYNGAALLGTDTSAPYAFSWASVPAGTYQLKAIAYDAAGLSGTSAIVTITVGTVVAPPTGILFHASPDHATTMVTSYKIDVFPAGANPSTTTPTATVNLGKPTPDANGDITANQPALFSGLAPGNYFAIVSAIGPGGTTPSAQLSFTR